jgi:hypothetical protein
MQVPHTRALMQAILDRSPTPGREGDQAVDWQVVARGVWRCNGGQMARPNGFTEQMSKQLKQAMSDLDADHMDPATASAVIQVGLYREVRYDHA